jgi:hypothetical protein
MTHSVLMTPMGGRFRQYLGRSLRAFLPPRKHKLIPSPYSFLRAGNSQHLAQPPPLSSAKVIQLPIRRYVLKGEQ